MASTPKPLTTRSPEHGRPSVFSSSLLSMHSISRAPHHAKDYCYSDDDIRFLLGHYIGDNHPSVAFLDPILADDPRQTLQANIEAYHRQRAENQSNPNNVLIPINLGQGHWVLAHVIYSDELSELPQVRYFNSTAAKMETNPSLDSAIHSVFLHSEIEDVVEERLQFNNVDCGVFILAYADAIANNQPMPGPEYNIELARERQAAVLDEQYQSELELSPAPEPSVSSVFDFEPLLNEFDESKTETDTDTLASSDYYGEFSEEEEDFTFAPSPKPRFELEEEPDFQEDYRRDYEHSPLLSPSITAPHAAIWDTLTPQQQVQHDRQWAFELQREEAKYASDPALRKIANIESVEEIEQDQDYTAAFEAARTMPRIGFFAPQPSPSHSVSKDTEEERLEQQRSSTTLSLAEIG